MGFQEDDCVDFDPWALPPWETSQERIQYESKDWTDRAWWPCMCAWVIDHYDAALQSGSASDPDVGTLFDGPDVREAKDVLIDAAEAILKRYATVVTTTATQLARVAESPSEEAVGIARRAIEHLPEHVLSWASSPDMCGRAQLVRLTVEAALDVWR
jgi:hypothetical protein